MKSFFTTILSLGFLLQLTLVMAMAAPQQQQPFKKWLEHYGAWDRLENEFAQESSHDSPETILKRAEVYLNLNSPQKALELIEMTPAFNDPNPEAKRLWMGGKAQRALGELSKAVLWFTQAGTYMDDATIRRQFKAEPGLETIWQDVWLKMYWSYSSNYTLSRDSQKSALDQVMVTGRKIWQTPFWNTANSLLNPTPVDSLAETPQTDSTQEAIVTQPVVTNQDTLLIAFYGFSFIRKI